MSSLADKHSVVMCAASRSLCMPLDQHGSGKIISNIFRCFDESGQLMNTLTQTRIKLWVGVQCRGWRLAICIDVFHFSVCMHCTLPFFQSKSKQHTLNCHTHFLESLASVTAITDFRIVAFLLRTHLLIHCCRHPPAQAGRFLMCPVIAQWLSSMMVMQCVRKTLRCLQISNCQ